MEIKPAYTQELSRLVNQGELTLLVGAGASVGAGLPDWVSLVRPLAQAAGYPLPDMDEFITADHLLRAVQRYENQCGLQALIQKLRDMLDIGVRPTGIHLALARLPIRVIFTTNYDDLIEQSLREAGRRPNVVVDESGLALWSEHQPQLIKLCGDLFQPASIVVTQRDFNTYQETHRRIAERLRSTLETSTLLCIGYSMQDPFFNQVWDAIGLDFGRLRRQGYAVLFATDVYTVDDLRQRGIHVITLETYGRDKTAALADWLASLGPGRTGEVVPLPSPRVVELKPDTEGKKEPTGSGRSEVPTRQTASQSPSAPLDLGRLHEVLTERCSLSEISTLCFFCGLDPAELPGEDKSAKIGELLRYLDHRRALPRLIETISKLRPDITHSIET